MLTKSVDFRRVQLVISYIFIREFTLNSCYFIELYKLDIYFTNSEIEKVY